MVKYLFLVYFAIPITSIMSDLEYTWEVGILHCKKLQRILQCFTLKLLQRTTVSAIYSELLLFFYIYFRQILCFYSVKCKMLWYIVKSIVKYRDFFNRQIRVSILPTKYCKFCIFYSKPVIFLQETVFFTQNCKTNKIQLFVKYLQ